MVELRKDVRSAPPGSRNENTDELSGALNVISLRTPGRAKTAPSIYSVRQSSGLYTVNLIKFGTCIAKRALTNRADPDQTASKETV